MSRLLLSNKLCQVMEINKLSFNSLHAGLLFMILLSFADFFQNQLFQKLLSGKLSDCQSVWIQIRTDFLSVLIWVQTVLEMLSADDISRC